MGGEGDKEIPPPYQEAQELSTKRQDPRITVDYCSKANFRKSE